MSLEQLATLFQKYKHDIHLLPDIREHLVDANFLLAWDAEQELKFEVKSLMTELFNDDPQVIQIALFFSEAISLRKDSSYSPLISVLENIHFRYPVLVWICMRASECIAELYSYSSFIYYAMGELPTENPWHLQFSPMLGAAQRERKDKTETRAYLKYRHFGHCPYFPSEQVDPYHVSIATKLFGSFCSRPIPGSFLSRRLYLQLEVMPHMSDRSQLQAPDANDLLLTPYLFIRHLEENAEEYRNFVHNGPSIEVNWNWRCDPHSAAQLFLFLHRSPPALPRTAWMLMKGLFTDENLANSLSAIFAYLRKEANGPAVLKVLSETQPMAGPLGVYTSICCGSLPSADLKMTIFSYDHLMLNRIQKAEEKSLMLICFAEQVSKSTLPNFMHYLFFVLAFYNPGELTNLARQHQCVRSLLRDAADYVKDKHLLIRTDDPILTLSASMLSMGSILDDADTLEYIENITEYPDSSQTYHAYTMGYCKLLVPEMTTELLGIRDKWLNTAAFYQYVVSEGLRSRDELLREALQTDDVRYFLVLLEANLSCEYDPIAFAHSPKCREALMSMIRRQDV